MAHPVKTRSYDNARRAAAARRTQQRVVDTAHRLLLERGYAGLAMADLAEEAGVSVPLLYKAFGTKPRLVKRVYDVLLATASVQEAAAAFDRLLEECETLRRPPTEGR